MADKQITELPANSGVTNETLFPAYQPGAVEPAQKVSGAQFRAFAEQAGAAAGEQAAGDLARGGTFTPEFNPSSGYLSWTNDLGLPNPNPVQLQGVSSVNGKTGAVTLSAADVGAYDLTVGQIIPNGADMNMYLELGSYYSPNATVTASLKNAPATGAGFKLIVEQGYGPTHRIQKAYFNTTGRFLWRYAVGSSLTTGWIEAATTDYALARDGSNSMTGALAINNSDSIGLRKHRTIDGELYTTGVGVFNIGGAVAGIELAKGSNLSRLSLLYLLENALKVLLGGKTYDVLHTGNKPSGSYTGNGDATERVIETGGIGRWIFLVNNATGGWALLNAWGGMVAESGNIRTFNRSEAYYSDSKLTLKSTNATLNGTGNGIFYQVP